MTLFELHSYLKQAGFDRWGVSPARLYSTNQDGQTALEYLCTQFSVSGLKALAATNYQFNATEAYSGTAPSLSVITSEDPLVLDVLKVLFDNGLAINAVDKNGNNALHLANMQALKAEVLFLISKGIDYAKENEQRQNTFDVIPEAAERFLVPAINKAIKAYKKSNTSAISALTSLFHSKAIFSVAKKSAR
jgi:ankyrin repeat protein